MLNATDLSVPKKTSGTLYAKEADFSDNDFVRFRNMIRARSGIYFNDRKRGDLKSGVLKAFHYSGTASLQKYFDLLNSDPPDSPLFKTLVSFLTVGETYFFRHFDVIERVVLPALIKAHLHDKTLKIWSAGCSTGEEPYTVVMTLHHLLPDFKEWKISIVGTDININSVDYAREAVYRPWSLRSINHFYKNTYFEKRDGLYYLNDEVRKAVRFEYMNLMEQEYPKEANGTKDLDLIFCRNVTIYFEAETTIKVVNRFYECLKEKAFLEMGHAEPSSLVYDQYVSEIYPDAVIYRKDSATKKEQQYKTGIRIRRDIFKEYSEQQIQSKASILPDLTKLQHQIKRLDAEPVKEVPVKKEIPKPKPVPVIAKEVPLKESDRRLEFNESEAFAQAIELFQNKSFKDAERVFTELIEQNPSNGRALYMIAHINANLDNVAQAKEFCFRAIEKDSLLIEAYYLLGLIFKEENNFDESIKMLRKTIYIDANFAVGYYDLAVNYFKRGDTVQGKRYLKQTDKILKTKTPEDRVGVLDDLTARELGMMVTMWEN